jgi:hypothetical protein
MITRKTEYDLERINKYNEKPRYKLTLRLNFYKRETTKKPTVTGFYRTFYDDVLFDSFEKNHIVKYNNNSFKFDNDIPIETSGILCDKQATDYLVKYVETKLIDYFARKYKNEYVL